MAESDVTQLLHRWHDGDTGALDRLLPHVYADLRAMAARRLHAHDGHATLQPTALVHELILRLLGVSAPDLADRTHFFNLAGRVMRQLLVDRARRSAADKHGGQWRRESMDVALNLPIPDDLDVQHLDEALVALEAMEPRMAKIVELRYFVGLSVAEVANVLAVDERTVYRDWAMARAWLRERIEMG